VSTGRNLVRLGGRAFAVTTVVRQLKQARRDGDRLRLLDAAVNALTVLTAILIIIREIRERSEEKTEAVEESPV
jgi:hypothetical protein